ncbi:flavin reductase family protein [Rhodoferax sediminis]|nr:flavin reductase family protein [Rhodoferax sediminis]
MPPIDHADFAGVQPAGVDPLPTFTAREFRDAMGEFTTGVVVISTEFEGQAHAMTANAFMSGSLEPPLVLVSVAHTARMHARIRQAQCFAISILCNTQLNCSNHFAGKPQTDNPPLFERLHDLPVVAGASLQLATALVHDYDCGDHTLFVGHVQALRAHPDKPRPLLFHGGKYNQLAAADWSAENVPTGFWHDGHEGW